MSRAGRHGQALVEYVLLMPLLLLVTAGGLILGLAMFERQTLTWAAQEGARAAADALIDADRCPDARAAVEAVSGRSHADCIGTDGLTLVVDPITAVPRVATVTLDGSTWAPPFLAPVTVRASAGSVIEPLP